MVGRYFGGQYDSVKQSAYLNFILKDNKYKGKVPYQVVLDHYTARIRLDILFGGHVILTDAMFFDGVFFQTLFTHREKREDFINFINLLRVGNIPPLIEIWASPDLVDKKNVKIEYTKTNRRSQWQRDNIGPIQTSSNWKCWNC